MMQFIFAKTPLAYFVASFWRDEAFSYLMAKLPLHTLLWSTAQDANPPLYYLLLKLWMTIFGYSEVALRSLSLIFFWATLYVVFLIMNDVYKLSVKKSLFYLLLFICNPLLNYYAFEARMYSLLAFLATLLFYAMMKKKYTLFAYASLAALFTHYFLTIVIAFQFVIIFLTSHKMERGRFFHPLFKTIVWYIPWLIILIFARPPISGTFWVPSSSLKDFLFLPAIILTGYEKGSWMTVPFLSTISAVISGILIFGLIKQWNYRKKLHLLLILGWSLGIPLLIFILSFIKPIFLPRYLIFSSVGITLLLVLCLETIQNKYLRLAAIVIVVSLLLSYSSIQVQTRTKAPLKKIFSSIRAEMGKNDVVYVTHEYDFHPAQYYLPSKKIYIYKKTREELPWFVGKILMDKKAFRNILPVYPERAFIINNDGSYSIQSSR